jgi:hypothetical protein
MVFVISKFTVSSVLETWLAAELPAPAAVASFSGRLFWTVTVSGSSFSELLSFS